HPHKRRVWNERIKGAHAPIIGLRQIVADTLADVAVITVARRENQNRGKSVEAIAARQDAYPRTLVELQGRHGKTKQRDVIELEQFVARIGFEHIDQRLAGMAFGIEPGACQHSLDLAPQVGDRTNRPRINRRGEQTYDAKLADGLPVCTKLLHPYIVHVDSAV